MAVSFGNLPLIFSFIACFSANSISALSATHRTTELAIEVCKNTTIFDFCRKVIYSDPKAPTADRKTLAQIAFGQAYKSASKAMDYVVSWIESKKVGNRNKTTAGMENCRRFYGWVVESIHEAVGNINSETFEELDRFAVDAETYVRHCEANFNGTTSSPLSVMNQNLINHSYICVAVSRLFPDD